MAATLAVVPACADIAAAHSSSLNFLVVGDWGRGGTNHQSEVATQMGKAAEAFARGDSMLGELDEVRDRGTKLLTALVRHRQRGADLVYEGYSVDIGGQD